MNTTAHIISGIPLPPEQLIFMDNDAIAGFQHGRKLLKYAKSIGFPAAGRVWDIGCGYGRLAYALLDSGFDGVYFGMDILKNRIEWLQNNFSSRRPSFRFFHSDIRNDRYNKGGKLRSLELSTLVDQTPPDGILLLSVFTHMYEADITHYLDVLTAALRPGGMFIFTAFLYDSEVEDNIEKGVAQFTLTHHLGPHCRYEFNDDPLHAIAYSRDYFVSLLSARGLSFEIFPGSWSGRKSEPYQDWIKVKKVID